MRLQLSVVTYAVFFELSTQRTALSTFCMIGKYQGHLLTSFRRFKQSLPKQKNYENDPHKLTDS